MNETFIFRDDSLFFYPPLFFLFFSGNRVSFTLHLHRTNAPSQILFVFVDDNIVKWTVINNVNMFFLNKDFNKIASNERTSVISLELQRN